MGQLSECSGLVVGCATYVQCRPAGYHRGITSGIHTALSPFLGVQVAPKLKHLDPTELTQYTFDFRLRYRFPVHHNLGNEHRAEPILIAWVSTRRSTTIHKQEMEFGLENVAVSKQCRLGPRDLPTQLPTQMLTGLVWMRRLEHSISFFAHEPESCTTASPHMADIVERDSHRYSLIVR
jgi:hypothetical protein